jgi:transcriptional regulator with XRE-family HTH domain
MTEQEIRDALGKNIKKYRKQSQLSQEKLANEVDMTTNFLSEIENGRKWPSPATLAKLTEALDINVDQLFKAEELLPTEVSALLTQYAKEGLEKLDKSLHDLRKYYLATK